MNIFNLHALSGDQMAWLVVLFIWTIFWKGLALWTAADRKEKGWFIALLILNTAGILEIVYLFGFAKKTWSDIMALFKKSSSSSEPTPSQ